MSDANGAPAAGDDIGRKRALLRTWLTLTAAIGIATFLFYRLFWAGHFASDRCAARGCALGPAASALASFVSAAGVALLLAILLLNRGRYRQVFRRSRARLIGAAALAALAPVVIYSGEPWILLPTLLVGVGAAFSIGAGFAAMSIPVALLTFLVAIALAYPVSCLLVSGLHRKLVRLAGFSLVWWSAYYLVLMLFGLRRFML